MESTGTRNKIQISQATADILTTSGKSHWMKPREDAVAAKGKGFLKTFWVNPNGKLGNSSETSGTHDTPLVSDLDGILKPERMSASDAKTQRLVDWVVDLLLVQVKKMASHIAKNGSKPFDAGQRMPFSN